MGSCGRLQDFYAAKVFLTRIWRIGRIKTDMNVFGFLWLTWVVCWAGCALGWRGGRDLRAGTTK